METYFNDHQKHCQYKLHNLKNVHNCWNPVNSLNFVLRLDMNRWEFMVAKIASWYFHFWSQLRGQVVWTVMGDMWSLKWKHNSGTFAWSLFLLLFVKWFNVLKQGKNILVKWPLTWPLLHQYSRACFHLLFTFYDIKLVFIVILSRRGFTQINVSIGRVV